MFLGECIRIGAGRKDSNSYHNMALQRVTGTLKARSPQELLETALARVGHAVSLLEPGQAGSTLYGLAIKARWREYTQLRDVEANTKRSSLRQATRRHDDLSQDGPTLRSSSFRGQRIRRSIPPASV